MTRYRPHSLSPRNQGGSARLAPPGIPGVAVRPHGKTTRCGTVAHPRGGCARMGKALFLSAARAQSGGRTSAHMGNVSVRERMDRGMNGGVRPQGECIPIDRIRAVSDEVRPPAWGRRRQGVHHRGGKGGAPAWGMHGNIDGFPFPHPFPHRQKHHNHRRQPRGHREPTSPFLYSILVSSHRIFSLFRTSGN